MGVVWVGGYSVLDDGTAEGVGVLHRRDDGGLRFGGTAVEAPDPAFLLADPDDPDVLFAVDEGGHGVQSFRRSGVDRLEAIGRVSTGGSYPCHLGLRRTAAGRFLDVSCYGDGAIAVHPVDEAGRIGDAVQVLSATGSGPLASQEGPHAHATLAVGPFVLSADLGADRVNVHEMRDDGLLERVDSLQLPPGTGPRDLVRHPSGALWLLGEWGADVTVLTPSADGFHVGETVALAPRAQQPEVEGDQAAALSFTTDGLRAFAGLRGSNRLAVISVDPDGRRPRPVGTFDATVDWPRHHVLEGEILHVAGQRSGTVATMRLDAETGGAAPIGDPVPVPTPTYLLPEV